MSKIEEIKKYLEEKCKSYYQTISLISKRTDGKEQESMIDSPYKMYNYDQGILKKIRIGENNLCSVDGIEIKNEMIYFIEFKDGKIFGNKYQDERKIIRLKLLESLIELTKIPINMTFTDILALKKIFVLVYSEDIHLKRFKDNYEGLPEGKRNLKAQIEEFSQQLKKYKIDELYTDIFIYEKKEFIRNFLNKVN